MSSPEKKTFLKENKWYLLYFVAGVLFIVLSNKHALAVPFWPRFIILTAWGIGMAVIFGHVMSKK